ncbi:hypothetical protein [Vagococcus fluvialis]|uniref:hypothetical protein n=1 Tax=Vagococcus fluvialis TaxID=2738 RepID=UPI003B5A5974
MKILNNDYDLDYSYMEVTIRLSPYVQELGDPIFYFDARFYIQEKIVNEDGELINLKDILATIITGHTGDFNSDYTYSVDAISDHAIESYVFLKGLYEDMYDSKIHDEVIIKTGQVMNRWVTLEWIYLGETLSGSSEVIQVELFECALIEFKKRWNQLFHGDVNLVGFSEDLYVSGDEIAQKKIKLAYKNVGFISTLKNQKIIEDNIYNQSQNIRLKDIFKLDVNNQLFNQNIKDPSRGYYFSLIYND